MEAEGTNGHEAPPPVDAPVTEAPPKTAGAAAWVKIAENGIVLNNLEDLLRFARLVVEGGAAPEWAYARASKAASPDQAARAAAGAVAVAIQAGLEHGLGILGGLQAFVVLDGHVSWRGEAAAAKIRNSKVCIPGTLKFWCEGEGTQIKGVAVAHRVGYRDPDRREFTFQDAQRASVLGKFNWTKYPTRMYAWRALAWLAKDVFGDLLGGFPCDQEVRDFDRPLERRNPSVTDRTQLAPPPAPDPLMSELGINAQRPAAKQTVEIEAQAVDPTEGQPTLFGRE